MEVPVRGLQRPHVAPFGEGSLWLYTLKPRTPWPTIVILDSFYSSWLGTNSSAHGQTDIPHYIQSSALKSFALQKRDAHGLIFKVPRFIPELCEFIIKDVYKVMELFFFFALANYCKYSN